MVTQKKRKVGGRFLKKLEPALKLDYIENAQIKSGVFLHVKTPDVIIL